MPAAWINAIHINAIWLGPTLTSSRVAILGATRDVREDFGAR